MSTTSTCTASISINPPLEVYPDINIPPPNATYQGFNINGLMCPNLQGGEYANFVYTSVEVINEGAQNTYYIYINMLQNTNDNPPQTVVVYYDDNTGTSLIDNVIGSSHDKSISLSWNIGDNSIIITRAYGGYSYEYDIKFISGNNRFFTSMTVTVKQKTLPPLLGLPGSSTNPMSIPNITINATLSQVTYDTLEVEYYVTYYHIYECGLDKYYGFTQRVNNTNNITNITTTKLTNTKGVTTLFYLVPLGIAEAFVCSNDNTNDNCSYECRNEDLIQKIANTPFGSNISPLIGYALLKMILGRVLFEEFDIKWLYRAYYKKLIKRLLKSDYSIFYTDFLGPNRSYEQYFNYCPC